MIQSPICSAPLSQTRLSWVRSQLERGATIAYPTEGVYGLGCLPERLDAIEHLLHIKDRPWQKGVLLVASDLTYFAPYIQPLHADHIATINDHYQQVVMGKAHPTTWIVPTSKDCSPLIRGTHQSVGIRLCAHPLVQQLSDHCASPLVSTSANISGREPARNARVLRCIFRESVDVILSQPTLGFNRASQIQSIEQDHTFRA